jgi:hypothetical protein
VAHIDVFKSWAGINRQDIEAFNALLESGGPADAELRLTSHLTRKLP